ncbi:unnamed protein product [Notodromas monacha]|uniref:Uncharacterized protein n=1 Tax=Notodromas monacha TaxID=399045 RepID=A0A7R9BS85_9CRUS|nr:unnamed protein product [Notodromas monacha]CAG0920733.1 unnamed protein product [Notodromas monacha]
MVATGAAIAAGTAATIVTGGLAGPAVVSSVPAVAGGVSTALGTAATTGTAAAGAVTGPAAVAAVLSGPVGWALLGAERKKN